MFLCFCVFVFLCFRGECPSEIRNPNSEMVSRFDADIVEDAGGQVGADVGAGVGFVAATAGHGYDVGDAAQVDGLTIHGLHAFDGDGDFGTFAIAGGFYFFHPSGGGGAGGDDHLAVYGDVAAHKEVERVADRYFIGAKFFVEREAHLGACCQGHEGLRQE